MHCAPAEIVAILGIVLPSGVRRKCLAGLETRSFNMYNSESVTTQYVIDRIPQLSKNGNRPGFLYGELICPIKGLYAAIVVAVMLRLAN